jgi:hypothetical protein
MVEIGATQRHSFLLRLGRIKKAHRQAKIIAIRTAGRVDEAPDLPTSRRAGAARCRNG